VKNITQKNSDSRSFRVQYKGGQFNSVGLLDHNVSIQQYFQLGKITRNQSPTSKELAKLAEGAKALTEYEIEKTVSLAFTNIYMAFQFKKINM
jgi:cobalt-zinc-cadmium resistance protein CzcA